MAHAPECPCSNDPDATCACGRTIIPLEELALQEAPIYSLAERRQRRADAAREHQEGCENCGGDEWDYIEWDYDPDAVNVVDDPNRPIMIIVDCETLEAMQMSVMDALALAHKLVSAVKAHEGIDDGGGDGPQAG